MYARLCAHHMQLQSVNDKSERLLATYIIDMQAGMTETGSRTGHSVPVVPVRHGLTIVLKFGSCNSS